jgi:hypothetical protein
MTDHESDTDPLDGTYVAVLDRFETMAEENTEIAVLLVEDDDQVVDELLLDRADVPDDGRHQDAVFEVRFDDGELVEVVYDPETSAERSTAAQDRFDRLSKRLSREDGDAESADE